MTLTELLDEAVRRADLVIVVLGNGNRERVLVELGFALALRKRVLALLLPGAELPVGPVPHLRTQPDNREAIGFGLTQLLAAPPFRRRRTDKALPNTKPLGPIADTLLRKHQAVAEHANEQELADLVQEALTASGIAVMDRSVPAASAAERRTDFAVWSDDFEPWVGNPLLLEVRGRLARRHDLEEALNQMSAWLEKTGRSWGLLLYEGEEAEGTGTRHPGVLALTVRRFLELLWGTSLGDLLREMRNRRVHGRG
jgi:hypothetical protein